MSDKKQNIIKKEDLLKYKKNGYLTVGGLLEFIKENEIPNDAIVVTQRIEDIYYEQHGWKVYKKEGEHSHYMKTFNRKVDEGFYDDKEQYPDITEEDKKKFTEEDIEASMEQYHPVWCPVLYKDDKDDILFLDLHY